MAQLAKFSKHQDQMQYLNLYVFFTDIGELNARERNTLSNLDGAKWRFTRIPCVGEYVSHLRDEENDEHWYEVLRVAHFTRLREDSDRLAGMVLLRKTSHPFEGPRLS
ncbi:MAG: hypothetical protein F6K42_00620 [Leptolyngbya sp. SIO1D8]|nr:hypothetical protein [Leptolyngbya sp. SIO1D8]